MRALTKPNKGYKLRADVTYEDLKQAGFRFGTYAATLYDREAILNVIVDLNESPPYFGVVVNDAVYDHVYAPFYNRVDGQRNLILEEIDRRIDEELDGLVKKKILVCETLRRKRRNKNAPVKNSKI